VTARRFSAPWSIEDTCAAFVVKDAGGQKLGYFYHEEKPGRRSTAIPVLTATPLPVQLRF
jgi:hypothetical protein